MIETVSQRECYADVTTDDGVRHVLWKCTVEESALFIDEFAKIPNLYVADGHHRTAAAYNVGKIREEEAKAAGLEVTGEEPYNYFLTLFFPAKVLKIYDYNRVLKDLNGHSSEEFMDNLSQHFDISPIVEGETTYPQAIHKFSLLIDGKWFHMDLKETSLDRSTPIS